MKVRRFLPEAIALEVSRTLQEIICNNIVSGIKGFGEPLIARQLNEKLDTALNADRYKGSLNETLIAMSTTKEIF